MYMSVVVVGLLRLHPARRGHVRAPGTSRRSTSTSSRRAGSRVDEPELGGRSCSSSAVVAQFFCLTASTTSASRMLFAFSRDRAVPGHQLWRRVARNRVPTYAVIAIVVASRRCSCCRRSTTSSSATTSVPAIAVIGLYIAFILPVILRFRMGDTVRARGVEPRQALQVDRPDRDRLGLLHQRSSSSCRRTRSASRGRTASPGRP